MGSGSTIAAASSIGVDAIGIEIDPEFYALAERAIPQLAALYPQMTGASLDAPGINGSRSEHLEQMALLERHAGYKP
jgi:DNA modification methylase